MISRRSIASMRGLKRKAVTGSAWIGTTGEIARSRTTSLASPPASCRCATRCARGSNMSPAATELKHRGLRVDPFSNFRKRPRGIDAGVYIGAKARTIEEVTQRFDARRFIDHNRAMLGIEMIIADLPDT